VDDETAILDVPLWDRGRDRFTVHFDPNSGALVSLEAPRWRNADDAHQTVWTATNVVGATVGPWDLPALGAAQWADTAQPWAFFKTEDLRHDVDVSSYVRARGI
jgi:hypothetical protein